jgi:hypothetical protein
MKYFAKLIDGSILELTEDDYTMTLRVIARSIDRGLTLSSGGVLKSSAVIHIYAEGPAQAPAAATAPLTAKVKG